MRYAKTFLFIIALNILIATDVFACTCALSTLTEDFQTADAVFFGKVIHIDEQFGARFHVEKSWKLVDANEVIVYTDDPEKHGCAYRFQKDESYIVYAGIFQDKLYTDQCSATAYLVHAGEQLADMQGRTEIPLVKKSSNNGVKFERSMKIALITGAFVLIFLIFGLGFKVLSRRTA
ncbi:hypothetical protein BH18ACI2_BH18ACI2_23050 [soil metagenome]